LRFCRGIFEKEAPQYFDEKMIIKRKLAMKTIDKDTLKQAIFEYRELGKKLMFQLGQKYELDITKQEEFDVLISKSNSIIPRKGELTNRWNYSFHGGECGFYNKKHQQQVEVVLSNPPKFGHLDAWFVMAFMESTVIYKEAVKDVEWTDLKVAIQELYGTGDVINILR
jgi:hypothetical protein